MWVFAVFLGHFRGEVDAWICVLAPDWSKVCFLGLMKCHGHMETCVAACRHVALCGSRRAHMPISLIRTPMYANDISISIVSTSPLQWCRSIWHFGFFMMRPYLCHWFTCSQLYHSMCISMCPATKDKNTSTCGNCQYKPLF
jgi:hypothetical protein